MIGLRRFWVSGRFSAANIPVVPGLPLPDELATLERPLVVGLTKDPARLVQLRRNRLRMISDDGRRSFES